jgi:hypothetical protein
MKRLAVLLILALMSSSFAFSAGTIGFGAQLDYANLNVPEPLKSAYGSGFGGGLHVDFRFGIATLRVNGDYISFGADQGSLQNTIYNSAGGDASGADKAAIGVEGGRINILSFGANGKFALPNKGVSPYAIVGLGSATLSMSDLKVSYQGAPVAGNFTADTKTKFMVNAGAGVDFPLGGLALFVEAKYTWIFTEDEASTFFPVTIGVTF